MAGKITLSDFLILCDSIAKQAADLQAAVTSAGFANNRTTILGETDLVVDGALGTAFGTDPTLNLASMFASRINALKTHVGGDLSAYLLANDKRVHANFNDLLGAQLRPAGIFPPKLSDTAKLASYAATGLTTGTFTPGTAYDKTKYGKAWLNLHITHTIGGSLIATIVGKKIDGTSQSKAITLTGHSAGDDVAVGTPGTTGDHYTSVTGVTITAGTSLDAFDIETVVERAISL
jgi:hypothetical protein